MTTLRHRMWFVWIVVVAAVVSGCASVTPASDMTVDDAKAIILDSEIARLRSVLGTHTESLAARSLCGVARDDIRVEDNYFTTVTFKGTTKTVIGGRGPIPTITGAIPQLRLDKVYFASLGPMEASYSGWNAITPLTLFIVGPVIVDYADSVGWYRIDYISREQGRSYPVGISSRLGVLFPAWLLRPFVRTSSRELAEAVEFMRRRAVAPDG